MASTGSHTLREQVRAGACGLKLHEDWGATTQAIRTVLAVADEMDVQVPLHSDGIWIDEIALAARSARPEGAGEMVVGHRD